MPAHRLHVDHGRVAADHQLHVVQIRDPFEWLVIGQVVPRNPAAAVCGPRHSARQRKATVLDVAVAPSNRRSYWEVV